MAVDTFDPGALNAGMDEAAVTELLNIAGAGSQPDPVLSELQVRRFAPLVSHAGWADRAAQLTDRQIVGLIRVFTLGEMQHPSWAAGDKSAVIPLVRELKRRGSYDKSLTQWIKANTDNRFLPHGSLMDRL